jgi:hypothetical protein
MHNQLEDIISTSIEQFVAKSLGGTTEASSFPTFNSIIEEVQKLSEEFAKIPPIPKKVKMNQVSYLKVSKEFRVGQVGLGGLVFEIDDTIENNEFILVYDTHQVVKYVSKTRDFKYLLKFLERRY